jgi:hypothetical protein
MSIDDRKDEKLPVTAEVGGEGGSYADATQQAETLKGAAGNPRVDPKTVAASEGDLTNAAADGEQVLDASEMVKHATEPPGKR